MARLQSNIVTVKYVVVKRAKRARHY